MVLLSAGRIAVATTRPPVTSWGATAAVTCVAAGALHAIAAVDLLGTGLWQPSFFLACALVQLAAGGWLYLARPPVPRVVGILLVGTVGLVVLYLTVHGTGLHDVISEHGADADHNGHTVRSAGPVSMGGLPGVDDVTPEAPGWLGTSTVAVELLAITALTALLPVQWRSRTADALLLLGTLGVVLWSTGLLF